MLFDLESNKLQEGFRRLVKLEPGQPLASGATFNTDEGLLEVRFYAPGVLRLRIEKKSLPDYGLLAEAPQPTLATLHGSDGTYILEAGDMRLELQGAPLRLALSHRGRTILRSADDRTIQGELRFSPLAHRVEDGGEWLVNLALASHEAVYGLGEKFGGLNRRGQWSHSWNRDATGVNAEISYKNTPFAWSSAGWGLFVHTPGPVTHGVGYAPWSHRTYALKVHDANLDLFLFAADSPAQLLERFTWLTGRSPLPPLWSYGVWMSRAFYQTQDDILQVARRMRAERFPCDVLTLDGRAWHKPETRFDFSWDPDRYPDPAGFVRTLRDMNYRLCLWEYSYISTKNPQFAELDARRYFLSTPQGATYIHRWFPPPLDTLVPHLQPSGIVDFTNPEAYAWYRDAHKELFEMGVAVMKTDYGEAVPLDVIASNGDDGRRLHNIYALLYNRCVYEAAQRYNPDGTLVWGRAGWTSSARCPVQWGGDPQGDWEGLAASVRGGLSWGLTGVPFYAHDIGGFYGAATEGGFLGAGKPEAELYLRWMQAGVLAPMTRFHGVSAREPWEFGPQAEDITRRWMALRYRLIPYLQACAIEAQQTGLPLMRAMPLAFPNDRPAWAFETQYMLGPALLVAPVLEPGGRAQVYLPDGEWTDAWSGQRLQGPCFLEAECPLDRIPLYARSGERLLLGPAAQHTGELDGSAEAIDLGRTPWRLDLAL